MLRDRPLGCSLTAFTRAKRCFAFTVGRKMVSDTFSPRQFLNKGYHEGVYAAGVRVKGTIKGLISATKRSTTSVVLIHSAVDEE